MSHPEGNSGHYLSLSVRGDFSKQFGGVKEVVYTVSFKRYLRYSDVAWAKIWNVSKKFLASYFKVNLLLRQYFLLLGS